MILAVDDLQVPLPPGGDRPYAVDGVSFGIAAGELVCVVGESGSGKSVAARAVLGLLPDHGLRVGRGRVTFDGEDLTAASDARLQALRGRSIAMIFQEPMTALNPLMTVEAQIAELYRIHGLAPGRAALRQRIQALLGQMNLPDPERIAGAYPFELSGGQRQRAMIAMAFALGPRLLVADEPTTALDVTTQIQILHGLRRLQAETGTAVLFITHDFGVVAEIADRVVVMRGGQVVEQGPAAELLRAPRHDYTRALLASVPRRRAAGDGRAAPAGPIVLAARDLSKSFRRRRGLFRAGRPVPAVRGVSFELRQGETLSVVGESGSGKSTLSRCLVRLVEPDGGSIELLGEPVTDLPPAAFRRRRQAIQLVFQDPYGSLNPRLRVGDTIAAGPMAFGLSRGAARERAAALLALVGLEPAALDRYPHQFSGGQRQRIGLARALALEPKVLVADEPVSALDVTVQAQILALLRDVRERLGLAILFITHDLRVAAEISDRILVMQAGRVVEEGAPAAIFDAPRHDYTRQLIASIPGRGRV